MSERISGKGPVLRLFQVRIRQGHAETLLEKFATTSADVVRHEPGNSGYFFGRGIASDEGYLVFASLWDDLDAVKRRFGDTWQQSFLPEGYEDLIEEHSIRHVDLSTGWAVSPQATGTAT
ncbi:antibiotic biosynthesis monooxygenase [Roseibium sp.]|uniref:antibiotic biosynthesis monooxygenase n=1 Tax=Roseibium sp. TaxID=1936156 RepID=UPI003BAB1962